MVKVICYLIESLALVAIAVGYVHQLTVGLS